MSAIRELALAKATGGGGGGGIPAALIDRTITDIVVPDGVTVIEDYVFCNCVYVKSLIISDSVKSICASAFAGLGCNNGGIKFPLVANGVEKIGTAAAETQMFAGAVNISRAVLPRVKEIYSAAFAGCTGLEYIYLGPNCTTIASQAFSGVPITCKVECGFAEGAVSGFPGYAGFNGNPADLDITYNVAEPSE